MKTMYYNFEACRQVAINNVWVSTKMYEYAKKPEVIKAIEERFLFYIFIPYGHKCGEPDCEYKGTVKCIYDGDNWQGETWEYFCTKHASEHGFCIGCGRFYAGTTEFDFKHPGYCDNCYSEVCSTMEDERNEADELGIDVFDLPY